MGLLRVMGSGRELSADGTVYLKARGMTCLAFSRYSKISAEQCIREGRR